MNTFKALFLILTLSSCTSLKTDTRTSQSQNLVQKALKDQTGYNLIESLTTEIGPRMAGSKQEKRAREWAVKKMKTLGLSNVRVESFTVEHWERHLEEARILSPNPQKLRITSLGGSVGTPKRGLKGKVVIFKSFKDSQI